MNTKHQNEGVPTDRRRFLALGAGALLGAIPSPRATQAVTNPLGNFFTYTGGVVSNPELAGPAGELILNVYLAVDEDGTGAGAVSDVLHPEINCHLAVQQGARQGNTVRFTGVVQAAKDA